MNDDNAIFSLFDPLWYGIQPEEEFPGGPKFLTHYTSLEVLESILSQEELWFSNPLFMNDIEELRFGLQKATEAFHAHQGIREACATDERYTTLRSAYDAYHSNLFTTEVLDIYILCLSKHENADTNGLLSMWRGYGHNGRGAAIVFDMEQIPSQENSPLIIAEVKYFTAEERIKLITEKLDEFSQILKDNSSRIPTEKLYLAAHALFDRAKMFSLFTKHTGFSEEKEWRILYLPDRDDEHKFSEMYSYSIGNRGIEPKLKLNLKQLNVLSNTNLQIENLIDRIIIGPSISNDLTISIIQRMFEKMGKNTLIDKLQASTIPYRNP